MAINAHKVFHGEADSKSYLAALSLDNERERQLSEAREICRKAIRDGLKELGEITSAGSLYESLPPAGGRKMLRPKFRMQGSYAYGTLNKPAHNPPQQIDLDDGVFVPVSFLQQGHPSLVSTAYFQAVEACLAPICAELEWKLITDKASCVRVDIGAGAHIDMALYAIPDEDFVQLVEAVVMKSAHTMDAAFESADLLGIEDISDDVYQKLPDDHIVLAHREDKWKPSDPRKLETWFVDAARRYKGQLRRVCRYLKGWRDQQWPDAKLSSIALMKCVVTIYDQFGTTIPQNRDDLAILAVARHLPALLSGSIENPVVPEQYLDESWTPTQRSDYIAKARTLYSLLESGLNGTNDPAVAIRTLTAAFGIRIPQDVSLITTPRPDLPTPAILTSGMLKDTSAAQPKQPVQREEGTRRYG